MRGIRFVAAAALVSLFTLASAPAEAQTKSWTAAKALAPPDAAVVVSVDMTAVAKSSLYQSMVPMIIAQEDDAKEGLDAIKAGCGIDALTAVTDITVVMKDPDVDDNGLVVIGLNGINEAKAVACLKKIAKKEKKVLTAKKAGKITELSIKGESDKIYMAWLTKDVVALATEPDDKARLSKLLGGKGATGDLAPVIAKVDTSAAGWMAVAKKTPMDQLGTMTSAYGGVKLVGGTIDVELNLVMSSAAEAKKAADGMKKELAKVGTQMPAELQKVLKTVTFTANAETLTVKASVAESEVMSLVGLLMQM